MDSGLSQRFDNESDLVIELLQCHFYWWCIIEQNFFITEIKVYFQLFFFFFFFNRLSMTPFLTAISVMCDEMWGNVLILPSRAIRVIVNTSFVLGSCTWMIPQVVITTGKLWSFWYPSFRDGTSLKLSTWRRRVQFLYCLTGFVHFSKC